MTDQDSVYRDQTQQNGRQRVESDQNLVGWSLGMDLATRCDSDTRLLSKEEMFGMASQIRRAAASVPANIAEGYGREQCGATFASCKVRRDL